jgi:HPt (histidine-containing phosphotransfer) domain-containing protein
MEPDAPIGDEPLDRSRLMMLQSSGGGDDLVAELVELFVGDVPPRLEAIGAAISTDDPGALASAAHSLKGSSATMGAVGMSELCRQMEMHGRAGDMAQAAPILATLEAEFERVKQALHDWVSTL